VEAHYIPYYFPATPVVPEFVDAPSAADAVSQWLDGTSATSPGSNRTSTGKPEVAVTSPGSNATSAPQCVVCMDAAPTHAAVPCGHQCMCAPCAAAMRVMSMSCPMCRAPVTLAMRIYA
jgi:hypothetical protein